MDEDSSTTDSANGREHGETGKRRFGHVPVLLQPAIDFLAVQRGGTFIDATLGLGGHSYEIAKRLGAEGRLIGFDKDPAALERARERLASPPPELAADWPQIELVHASFAEVAQHVKPASVDGLLADLGVSSMQLENAERGFSFQADGPLDMRMNTQSGLTAEQVVNRFDERELADAIYEFGEERRSRRIARAIVRARPIHTTAHLAEVVSAAARPMNQAERRIHPATRTFQALRILVNRELDDLRELLSAGVAPQVLRKGGRLVVISFHSLEDRIVKDVFREASHNGVFRILTKKPVTGSEEEIDRNPRARSAKLRAAERI
jgi:16S rRNA (cytosine1402-N4)-methyltransferase